MRVSMLMLLLTHDSRAAGSRGILRGDLECAVISICPKYAYCSSMQRDTVPGGGCAGGAPSK